MTGTLLSPALHLPFDDQLDDGVLEDSLGNRHFLVGEPAIMVDETFGSCLRLQGPDSVHLGRRVLGLGHGFTASLWVRCSDLHGDARLLTLHNGPGVELALSRPADTTDLELRISGPDTPFVLRADSALETRTWQHVAVTVDAVGLPALYVDSRLVAAGQTPLDAWPARIEPQLLDQELQLRFRDSYYRDWGGAGEKWLAGTGGWYFVTPDDRLFHWTDAEPGPGFLAGSELLRTLEDGGSAAWRWQALVSSSLGGGFAGELAHFRLYDAALRDAELQQVGNEDRVANVTFREKHPFDFDLIDDQQRRAIYIVESPVGENLEVRIVNRSSEGLDLDPIAGPPGPERHHFELRFRPGTLSEAALGRDTPRPDSPGELQQMLGIQVAGLRTAIQADGPAAADAPTSGITMTQALPWVMSRPVVQPDQTVSLYFLNTAESAEQRRLAAGGSIRLELQDVSADPLGGSRGTRVQLRFRSMRSERDGSPVAGLREHHLNVISHVGERDIPLHVQFVGSNTVLNDTTWSDGKPRGTTNELTLRISNARTHEEIVGEDTPIRFDDDSRFVIRFDVQGEREDKPWALGTDDEVAGIEIDGFGRDIATVQTVQNREGGAATLVLDRLQEVLPVGTRIQIGGRPFTVALQHLPFFPLAFALPMVLPGPGAILPVQGDPADIANLQPSQPLLIWDARSYADDQQRESATGSHNWSIVRQTQGPVPTWEIRPPRGRPFALASGQHLQFRIKNVRSSLPTGPTNLYLHYENVPGYWDGQMVCEIQKSPLVFRNHRAGIGIADPQAKLDVAGDQRVSGGLTVGGSAAVSANLQVGGRLQASRGSRFTGDRHYFQDSEGKGRVRVGAAWGIPGLYAEDKSDLVLGCSESHSVQLGTHGRFMRVGGDGVVHIAGKESNGHGGSLHINYIRLGWDKEYGWIQSHGNKPLSINPVAHNVGIGNTTPSAKLHVSGSTQLDGTTRVNGDHWIRDKLFFDARDGQHWVIHPEWSDKADKDLFFDFSGNPSNWVSGWLEPMGQGWRHNSDGRLKEDLEPLRGVLERVLRLRPSSYRLKEASDRRRHVGFVAQEVLEVFPELVTEKRGYLGLGYQDFGVLAVAAIQEQQERIAKLEERLRELEEGGAAR